MVVVRPRRAQSVPYGTLWRVLRRTFVYVLEGRFGIRAVAPAAAARIADSGRGPGVILRCRLLVAAPASSGVAALVSTLAATESTATESAAVAAAETALAAGALGAVDFGIRVTQARADFVDFELDNGALLAFFCFVGTALQAAGDDNAHALGQGLGDVFGCFAPDRRAEEQGFPVLPLIGLPVEGAGSRSDGEIRYGRTGRCEPEFGVIGEVTDNRDSGFACHLLPPCAFLRG